MMRLNQINRPNKKPLLILAGIVVGVVVLCSGAWWYNAQRSTTQYREQLSAHVATVNAALKASNDRFGVLSKEGDAKKTIDELSKLSDALNKQAGDVPVLPQLFGITLTPQQDAQKRGTVVQHLKQLATDIDAAKAMLTYQNEAALALQSVTTKTGANAEQQKALADAWAAMIAALQAMQPPAPAQSAHGQIVAAATAAHAKIAALPDLFNKKDTAGFAAKQKEIETHLNELRALADGIQVLNVNQDKAIARSYQNLLNSLK